MRNRLWGYADNTRVIIFTPFKIIFDRIGEDHKEFKGWWRAHLLNNDCLIVLTPQGSQTIDAISCLEENTEIIFIGLAGSFGSLNVGDVVEPVTAFYDGSESKRTSSSELAFKTTSIVTVGSFAESFERLESLKKKAECVDMETGIIFQTSYFQGKTARSIQIISDDFSKNFFFDTDLKNIESQIEAVSNFIRKSADGGNL